MNKTNTIDSIDYSQRVAKQPKLVSTTEYDMLWMSARYCVGRHTIAASSHAGHIIKSYYNRLEESRRQSLADDIHERIYDVLRFSEIGFITDDSHRRYNVGICNGRLKPLTAFLDAVTSVGLNDDMMKRVRGLKVSYNFDTRNFDYKTDFSDYSRTSLFDIDDLVAWHNAAMCLDKHNHKAIITTTDEFFLCFPALFRRSHNSAYDYEMHFVPVNEYIANPFANRWIDGEKIKEVR